MSKHKSRRERAAETPKEIKPSVHTDEEFRQLRNQLDEEKRIVAAMNRKYGPCRGRAILAFTFKYLPKSETSDGMQHEQIETFFLDDPAEQVRGRNYLLEVQRSIEESWKAKAVTYTNADGSKGASERRMQFRSPESARKAYKGWCARHECADCPYQTRDTKIETSCYDRWLWGTESENAFTGRKRRVT